jgi:hypothetical protein
MALTEEEEYTARQVAMLAPLAEQTYGNLCAPANGRKRQTGILRVEPRDVQVPGSLTEEQSTEGDRTMNFVVAIVAAGAIGWIVFVAILIYHVPPATP